MQAQLLGDPGNRAYAELVLLTDLLKQIHFGSPVTDTATQKSLTKLLRWRTASSCLEAAIDKPVDLYGGVIAIFAPDVPENSRLFALEIRAKQDI